MRDRERTGVKILWLDILYNSGLWLVVGWYYCRPNEFFPNDSGVLHWTSDLDRYF